MSITENSARIGNFTSSEIYKLLSKGSRKMTAKEKTEHKRLNPKSKKLNIEDGFGELALTYIEEKQMEINLGLSLGSEDTGKAASWGKLLEKRAFEILGTSYSFSSEETELHPTISWWSGTKDGSNHEGEKATIDFKCPKTRKSFCQLVDPIYNGFTGMEAMNAIRFGWKDKHGHKHSKHKDGDKFYFQLISNACITGDKYAELIVYMPYKSQLDEIRELAKNYDGNQNKIAWVNWAEDNELPYIKDGGYYNDINIIRFEIPEKDKKLLTEQVLEAGKLLVYPKKQKYGPSLQALNDSLQKEIGISLIKSQPPIASEEQRQRARKRLQEYLNSNKQLKQSNTTEI